MKLHDPYAIILKDLGTINGQYHEEHLIGILQQQQSYVKKLRKAYRQSPCHVDFSDAGMRRAYMLAYYPYYIDPIYEVLESLEPKDRKKTFERQLLQVCFVGAGPAPEAVGLAAFIRDHCKQVKEINIHLLDLYSEPWERELNLTLQQFIPAYWPGGQACARTWPFDLCRPINLLDADFYRMVGDSHVIIMQNCLNDTIHAPDHLLKNVLDFYRLTASDSLFVTLDLNFDGVRDFIRETETGIRAGLGKVIQAAESEAAQVTPNITWHDPLDELFTGEDGLIARKYTRFYQSVWRKLTSAEPPRIPVIAPPVRVAPKPPLPKPAAAPPPAPIFVPPPITPVKQPPAPAPPAYTPPVRQPSAAPQPVASVLPAAVPSAPFADLEPETPALPRASKTPSSSAPARRAPKKKSGAGCVRALLIVLIIVFTCIIVSSAVAFVVLYQLY